MSQSHSMHAPPEQDVIKRCIQCSVQIVALKKGFLGGMSTAWNGSGTVVHPDGVILTNCHVANPRAMGMPAPPADRLAIAITDRSDEPPVISYFAQIVAQVPELDLAVLKIVADAKGRKVGKLKLPYLPVGNSDDIELGQALSIFGYPGIGGQTLTYTQGTVAGFTKQRGIRGRAWIKTDATIAGGNSGGTAVNHFGYLIGIPTQAAAGTGITPVDARPVVDTNRDGRVDQRDTPMAIGGFINGLRPVNLAGALLAKAGVSIHSNVDQHVTDFMPSAPKPVKQSSGTRNASRSGRKAVPAGADIPGSPFDALMFANRVSRDGRPVAPSAILPSGGKEIFATFEYEGMKNGSTWGQTWALDGKKVHEKSDLWDDGSRGHKVIRLANPKGLPDGRYHLVLTIGKQIAAEGEVNIGRMQTDGDTQISGQVVDASTGQGIRGATVAALKSGVSVRQYAKKQDKRMVFSSDKTDSKGRFVFPKQLPKGATYSLLVIAKDHKDLGIEGAINLNAQAPERAEMPAIPLQRGRG